MPNRAVHPRARSIFKARTKKPNFVLSVAATTIRLSFIIALCVGLALLGAVIGIAKAFVDTAPTLDLAALDARIKLPSYTTAKEPHHRLQGYGRPHHGLHRRDSEVQKCLHRRGRRAFTAQRLTSAYRGRWSPTSPAVPRKAQPSQQLIKQTVLSSEQSYKRKLQEAYLAMELETRYTKKQILESYLNTIFLGGSYYGVRVAAYGYFGKELDQLTLRECAMLAGLTRSPNYYNPRSNFYTRNTEGSNTPDITNNRTDYVLRQMRENGLITAQQYNAALDRSTASVLEKSRFDGYVRLSALRRIRHQRRGGYLPRPQRSGRYFREPLCDGKQTPHGRLQRLPLPRHRNSGDRRRHAGKLERLSPPARSVRQSLSIPQCGRHLHRNRAAAGRRVCV
ncbi:MAG: transglycosylase domain-containing protein [Christensenellales bacterium]